MESSAHRSRRKTVYAVIALTLVGLIALAYIEWRELKNFRSRPDWHYFEAEMTNAGPLSPLRRYVIFKPGSTDYNFQLFDWLTTMDVDKAPMDEANMRGFLSTLDNIQIINLTNSFSDNPNPILPHLKKKLFPSARRCFFDNTSDDDLNQLSISTTYPYGLGESEYNEHLEGYEPFDPLSQTPNETGFNSDFQSIKWGIEYGKIRDRELKEQISNCILKLTPSASSYFPSNLIPETGADAKQLLEKLQEKENFVLISKISSSNAESATEARSWLLKNLRKVPDNQLIYFHQGVLGRDIRLALFNRWIDEENEPRAKATFRNAILHGDETAAIQMAKPIIDGPDSSIKKDLIVIAARNHMALGKARIDQAFSGSAPRREVFYSYRDYLNSHAVDEYSRIARHGYLEVGKSFPAYYCVPPLGDEASELRAFMSQYPWSPSTDDAHLRLISRLFLDGALDEASHELDRLETTKYIDDDAKELIPQAAALIAKAKKGTFQPPNATTWYADKLEEVCASAHGGEQ